VGHRAGLDAVAKQKSLSLPGIEPWSPAHNLVIVLSELPRLPCSNYSMKLQHMNLFLVVFNKKNFFHKTQRKIVSVGKRVLWRRLWDF